MNLTDYIYREREKEAETRVEGLTDTPFLKLVEHVDEVRISNRS